jgi:hypothetical protein
VQVGHDHHSAPHRDACAQQVGDVARGSQRGRGLYYGGPEETYHRAVSSFPDAMTWASPVRP